MPIRKGCPGCELRKIRNNRLGETKIHTTLAPLATTSRSVGTDARVNSTHPMRDGDRRAMSLLHSDASERNMDNEMRRELETEDQ